MSILDTSPDLRGYASPEPFARRLLRAKKAYSTRFVAAAIERDPGAFDLITDPARAPRPATSSWPGS